MEQHVRERFMEQHRTRMLEFGKDIRQIKEHAKLDDVIGRIITIATLVYLPQLSPSFFPDRARTKSHQLRIIGVTSSWMALIQREMKIKRQNGITGDILNR